MKDGTKILLGVGVFAVGVAIVVLALSACTSIGGVPWNAHTVDVWRTNTPDEHIEYYLRDVIFSYDNLTEATKGHIFITITKWWDMTTGAIYSSKSLSEDGFSRYRINSTEVGGGYNPFHMWMESDGWILLGWMFVGCTLAGGGLTATTIYGWQTYKNRRNK